MLFEPERRVMVRRLRSPRAVDGAPRSDMGGGEGRDAEARSRHLEQAGGRMSRRVFRIASEIKTIAPPDASLPPPQEPEERSIDVNAVEGDADE
jgi:hypothetical protein